MKGVREVALRRIELCQNLSRMTNEKHKVRIDSCLCLSSATLPKVYPSKTKPVSFSSCLLNVSPCYMHNFLTRISGDE